MLEQEGLSQISCSAASEQVAYFLVERVALLGKLEVAARQLESHSIIDGLQVPPALWLWLPESCEGISSAYFCNENCVFCL